MALQRPIPPPRRSKLPKTNSSDVGDLELPSKFELSKEPLTVSNTEPSTADDKENGNDHRDVVRNDQGSLPIQPPLEETQPLPPAPPSSSIDEQKNRFFAVDNPGYDSRTIPFRSKPSTVVARTTSNLMWFESGVPVEFKAKSAESNRFDPANEVRQTPSQVAFAALDESSALPPPVSIPPICPAVASLYPKLPPSPVLPTSSFDFSASNDPKSGLPNGLPSYEKPIEESNASLNFSSAPLTLLNGPTKEAHDWRSSRNSTTSGGSFREGRFSPAVQNSSMVESDIFDEEEEERLRKSMEACKLTLNQPSIDGSVSSTASETLGRSVVEEQLMPEAIPQLPPILPAVNVMDANDKFRLVPVGTNICNVGWLNKLGTKKKDTVRRWCVLKNGIFDVYIDDMADRSLESVSCKAVEMVFVRMPTELIGYDGDAAYIFSISFLTDGRKVETWTFSADRQDDLLVWITLLTKCIVQSEAADLCEAVDRAGPLYLKKGTTADWERGWFVMRGKVLLYAAEGDACCYEVDIRKVIRIRIITDAADCCPTIQSQVPYAFVVSTEGSALYAQSQDDATSKAWKNAIESSLTERTGLIAEQRLTTDDIPIIVEKCISFVAVYGLNIEGIYRHSGTLTKVKVLFELFMKDPHDIHLRVDEYTVHDVTSVLKRYFRQLDEPLVTSVLRPRLIEKSGLKEHGSRIMAFKRLLSDLPQVNYNTLRKILLHLKIVSQHAGKNMMNTQNLAAIFGPTLFYVDGEVVEEGSSSFVSTSQAINTIADMITSYDDLFNIGTEDLQKEKKIEEAMQKIENHNLVKTPSQLLLPIHVFDKDANVFNMPVRTTTFVFHGQTSNKITAGDVCAFAVTHKKLAQTVDRLALFEVVCNGQLERILGVDEQLLDIVSRWTSWPLEERATNYLIVKVDHFKQRMESMTNISLLTSCDVQFSDAKSFRKCTFQCSRGEILMYKNAKGTKPLQSWAVDKVFWYFGCETRRQAPTKYCLTFLEKDTIVRRSKMAPFFGRSVSFHDELDLLKWLTTVTLSNRPLRADF